ncbi:MAG TPA: glycosyltransferase family 4 protein [Vicinamibacterales bacterium]|nr:glycosyltransferase family 4 protein [Vicinamibacterales bacterium]
MRPRFAVCFDGRLAAELDASGAACARLGDVRVSRPHTVLRARRRLADLLTTDRPDAVICHSTWTFGLSAPVLRRISVPAVLWVHDRLSGRPWAERWAGLTIPAAIISNSRFTAESVHALYPTPEPSIVYAPIPAPLRIDDAERRGVREALGVQRDGECVVLIASRFEAWKGHQQLLAALATVTPPWRLWIAGGAQKDGEATYVAALRATCEAGGIADRVRFLGDRRDVPTLMQAADIHCQPNAGPEPFGLAFVEALHAGLPVVTTAMGGAIEIVTPACGVLVPPSDGRALRDTLERLILSGEARLALGMAGPARARELCDPARQLHGLSTVVRSVAA